MWIRKLFMMFCGLVSGGAIAAGTFAFIMIINIVLSTILKKGGEQSDK